IDLEALSVNDLWSLHEQISEILSVRIAAEKRELEKRLAVLNRGRDAIQGNDSSQSYNANGRRRRKYPRVFPKYRDPQTSETWSGRGKTPRWLVAAIKKGRKIEDFEIQASESKNRRYRRKVGFCSVGSPVTDHTCIDFWGRPPLQQPSTVWCYHFSSDVVRPRQLARKSRLLRRTKRTS